jgi:hypothetical protein
MNTTTTHFAPVLLYSEDAKAVHDALLASGHTDLAQMIGKKARRSRLDKLYAHVTRDNDDELTHDDEPIVSQSAGGAHVQVWKWVCKDDVRQTLRGIW